MDVILLNDVEKLGLRGEVVHVADGYARNFLLPRKLAERATPAKVAELEKRDAQRARHEAASADQADPTGTLFGSVTSTNVADEIWRTRKIRVDRRKIGLDDSIKRIGRYAIPITLFEGVEVEVKTLVVPEGGELPPEEELAAMEAAEAAEEAARLEAEGGGAADASADEELIEVADELEETSEATSEAAPDELDETPEMHEAERPDDEFDLIADQALERPGEEL
jgi:large subunit ribosomal protein L9